MSNNCPEYRDTILMKYTVTVMNAAEIK